jgi:hypothetical protein
MAHSIDVNLHRTTQTEKIAETVVPGFEAMRAVFERSKTVCAFDRAATARALFLSLSLCLSTCPF